jgi:hypothetical protein
MLISTHEFVTKFAFKVANDAGIEEITHQNSSGSPIYNPKNWFVKVPCMIATGAGSLLKRFLPKRYYSESQCQVDPNPWAGAESLFGKGEYGCFRQREKCLKRSGCDTIDRLFALFQLSSGDRLVELAGLAGNAFVAHFSEFLTL